MAKENYLAIYLIKSSCWSEGDGQAGFMDKYNVDSRILEVDSNVRLDLKKLAQDEELGVASEYSTEMWTATAKLQELFKFSGKLEKISLKD